MDESNELDLCQAAHTRIAGFVLKTPLLYSPHFSNEQHCNVYLKMESEQITNSFKVRGATNKVRLLYEIRKEDLTRDGIITASSGNHGLACAHACLQLGIKVTCYTCTEIANVKAKNLLAYKNMTLVKHYKETLQAERHARSLQKSENAIYVSSYNDMDVIMGQSSIGCEILENLPNVDTIIVPVGGGSLIAGIGMYVKLVKPSVQIIGCQPKNDAAMWTSIQAGHIVDIDTQKTLADGVGGNIEENSVTFPICQKYVDQWVLVEEDEIEQAVYSMLKYHKRVVEGTAGLAIAALRKLPLDPKKNKNIVLIMCGGNISLQKIKYLIEKYDDKRHCF